MAKQSSETTVSLEEVPWEMPLVLPPQYGGPYYGIDGYFWWCMADAVDILRKLDDEYATTRGAYEAFFTELARVSDRDMRVVGSSRVVRVVPLYVPGDYPDGVDESSVPAYVGPDMQQFDYDAGTNRLRSNKVRDLRPHIRSGNIGIPSWLGVIVFRKRRIVPTPQIRR